MSDVKKTRNFVHVPFDRITCPVTGCDTGPDGKAQEGTVPGIKRHARRLHPKEYGNIEFPAIRTSVTSEAEAVTKESTAPDDLSKLTVPALQEKAKAANVEGYSKMKKPELVAALTS